MQNATEQDIQKTIIDYLKIKHYVVFKHHSTGSTIRENKPIFFKYGDKGISDIIGCSPKGKFIAIEVKKPGKKASEEQLDFLERINRIGGTAFIAHSLDDVMAKIENPS